MQTSRLKEQRLHRGLSLRRVSDVTGIPKSTLDRIEKGEQSTTTVQGRLLYEFYEYQLSLGEIHDPMFDFEVAGAA